MSVLVLGGAGYVGSHAVYQLIDQGKDVVVIDNLQTGHEKAVHPDATFYEGDIRDIEFLRQVFDHESIESVIHFAANSLVGESMEIPLTYFDNNVYGTQVLLQAMVEFDVKKIVFSSTAATYGEPKTVPITEDMETNPTNAYGETKLTMEKMMKWAEKAHGIHYVSLRYFNVAGVSHGSGRIRSGATSPRLPGHLRPRLRRARPRSGSGSTRLTSPPPNFGSPGAFCHFHAMFVMP